MFFRIKKIKGKEYVYIVENEWKGKKGSRQKVKSYLGRAFRFQLKNDISFMDFLKIENYEAYIKDNKKNKIIKNLVEWEIYKFGISADSIDLDNFEFKKSKKTIVFLINEGFMCNLTLKNLIKIDSEIDGYNLARSFIEAGIKVPQEVFIGIFGKISKNDDNSKSI